MSGVNVRNLDRIQDKWLLFQRFVTSIVGSKVKFNPLFNPKFELTVV